MAKIGRPLAEIDWQLFEELCALFCTQSELASVLKINVDTLHDRAVKEYGQPFSEIYKKFQEKGKTSLRRFQFNMAKKNATMAIWLGKQYLGQSDTISENHLPPDIVNQYNALMKQIANYQSNRRMADNSSNKE